MSNIEGENPTPNQPNSRVSSTSAGRITATARTYNTASMADIATVLSQLAAINDRLSLATDNLSSFLQQHRQDQNMIRSAVGSGARVPGGDPLQPSVLASPRLMNQFKREREQLVNELKSLDAATQRKRLESLGIRGTLGNLDPFAVLSGGPSQAQANLNPALDDALVRSILEKTAVDNPNYLREAMRLRTLRKLDKSSLSSGGILRSLGGALGMGGGSGAHHGDPIQEAITRADRTRQEASGRIYVPGRGMGDRVAEGLGGILERGGLLGGSASLLLRAVPIVGTLLALPQLLNHFGLNPISRINQVYSGQLLSGQLTGQGFGAGIGASLDARRIRSGGLLFAGLNPFDPITSEIANQIVTSVRTAGFTGDRARSLYQSVSSVYRDLGLSIDTTTKIIADATRVGGESLRQISNELHGFDDAAHSLSMNINTYAESVMTVGGTLRSAGGGVQSTRVAQALIAGAPRILREGGGLAQYQQVYANAQPFLAAQLGVPVQYLGLSGNLPHTIEAFQQQIQAEINRMPGATLEEKAANASRFGILFKGMDIPNIMQLVEQIQSGRGPGATLRMEQIRGRLNQATLHSTLVAHVTGYGRGPGHVTQSREMVAIGGQQLRSAQMTALNQLRPFLNNKQIAELQNKIGDQHDFQQLVQRFEGQSSRSTGRSVNINGVTISLSQGASKILRLDVNKEAVRQGTLPANRQYTSETDRVTIPSIP